MDLYLQRNKARSFEEATDEAIDALKKQITKHKAKEERSLINSIYKNI